MKNNRVFYVKKENGKQMRKMRRLMSGISILVIRWNGFEFRDSKPCKHCSEHMKALGLKSVYYSNDDGSITRSRIKNLESNHVCMARQKILID
jgi:deoxycytidylate deaminase